MTPQEFKAWFYGFTEAVEKAPTQKQWARIVERVAEIDGKAVTEHVYVDRYWPAVRPYIGTPVITPNWTPPYPTWTCTSVRGNDTTCVNLNAAGAAHKTADFCSLTAMNALGRADASTLARA